MRLLSDAAGNALGSVQEFGVGRFAPATPDVAYAAQRDAGIDLVGQPRDVQLVLSPAGGSAAGTWTFVVVRGLTLKDLQDRVDQAVTLLESELK